MARKVTVSSICTPPLHVLGSHSSQQIAISLRTYWQQQLELVLPDQPELIVLPEKSNVPRGLSSSRERAFCLEYAEEMEQFMCSIAQKSGSYMAYSSIRPMVDGTWRNSTQLIDRNGVIIGIYDKNYPTIEEMEDQNIRPGNEVKLMECDFGTVACGICFDLLFDAHLQRYADCKPEIIIYSSLMHGGSLANSWAYSSRAHLVGAVAGVQSYVISPLGQTIATSSNYTRYVTHTINLDCKVAFWDNNFQKIKDAKRKYGRGIKVVDPGFQGSILISSESEGLDVNQIIREFKIELIDEYLQRSAVTRFQHR
ncbi:carbon-nitrogen hydrolase family protein [Paenibacillus koleovorans]|uniref:carbon-nitrogen hydrolase family protein n=1 Tax=Paenibacillus koleovorans TaxID=121608 RepID=UPI0013E345FF|nr:carbon-nitrogen hydrolase family protein [Paenibacillus koleovorans]